MKGWNVRIGVILICSFLALPPAAAEEPSEIFGQTLPMDIRASSFSELAEWCRSLGLSSQGVRTDLEERLFKHYGVTPPKKEPPEESVIEIQSAQSTEYFTLEQYDEDYVRLDGGVRISLKDAKKGYTYTIQGDSILFNRSLKLLSASGHVEYKISGEGRDEVFSGESLTLNTETWEGYFFEGTSFRDRKIDNETMRFRIQGEFISRSSEDFVVMEDAHITSSPAMPPNYRIKARKVWILGPGEWGLKDASLYVGNIPVFYFPFFFYPGDEVLFHPVFGYRSREGTFLQTTVYFLGNRKTEELPFSFLQLTENDTNDQVKERQGIFLRDTERKIQNPEWYLKGIFDVYSRLGAFAGLGGELSGLTPNIKTFKFDAGIGISRNLYFGQQGLLGEYTPYWQNTDGDLSVHWNKSQVGPLELPFRFGGTGTLSMVFDKLTVNILLESYSDPYIDQDFYDRQEQIDWSQLMEGILEEEETVILKDRLTMRVESIFTPSTASLSPLVTSLSVSRFLFSLDWRSKEIPGATIQSEYPYRITDPTRRFYYPDTFTLPELSLQIGGTLLSSDKRKPAPAPPAGKAETEKDPGDGLRPPWTAGEAPVEDSTEEVYKLPAIPKDIAVSAFPLPLGYSVTYQIRPKAVYQFKTDAKNWIEPQDVRYDFAYSTLTLQNTAQVLYDLRFYESLLQTKGSVSLGTQYQNVDFQTDTLTPAEKDSISLQAYRYTSLSLSHNFDAATYPLFKTDMFKASNVRYVLQTTLYKKSFDTLEGSEPVYKDQYLAFSKDMITAHKASMDITAETLPVTPKIQLSYICPPLDEVFAVAGSLVTGPLTSTTTFQTKNIEDRWVNQPISFDEYLKLGGDVEFRTTYLYDYVEDTPYSLVSTLRLWYLTSSFGAKYTEPYTFTGTGWDKEIEKEFIPSSASVGLRYALKPEPQWKNRILLSADVNADWQMNLIRYTETALNFGFTFNFSIHRFLDLKFTSLSKNTMMYQYFPGYAEETGTSWRNPFSDLLKSFNFFNRQDRKDSHFKLSSISFEAVHHLDDWDLSLTYTGKPEFLTMSDGSRNFIWNSELGIALRWKPIPQIKSEFSVN